MKKTNNKDTIQTIWARELKKAKARAKKLPEGWKVKWPSTPRSYKELQTRIENLQKVSVKTLREGTLPSYVKFSNTVVRPNGTTYKSEPITHTQLKDIVYYEHQAEKELGLPRKTEKEIQKLLSFTSKESFKKFKNGKKKRASRRGRKRKNEIFKQNFLKSMDSIINQASYDIKQNDGGYVSQTKLDMLEAATTAKAYIESLSATEARKAIYNGLGLKDTYNIDDESLKEMYYYENKRITDRIFGSSQWKINRVDIKRLWNVVPASLRPEEYA